MREPPVPTLRQRVVPEIYRVPRLFETSAEVRTARNCPISIEPCAQKFRITRTRRYKLCFVFNLVDEWIIEKRRWSLQKEPLRIWFFENRPRCSTKNVARCNPMVSCIARIRCDHNACRHFRRSTQVRTKLVEHVRHRVMPCFVDQQQRE